MMILSPADPLSAGLVRLSETERTRLQGWLKDAAAGRLLDATGTARTLIGELSPHADWRTPGTTAETPLTEPLGADFVRLPYADGFFDATVGVHLLERVPIEELAGVLDELARVTQGRLLLVLATAPAVSTHQVRCPHCAASYHIAGHLHHIAPADVIAALASRGFGLAQAEPIGPEIVSGAELDPLLFQKHFWEHQFHGSHACSGCTKLPSSYYDQYDIPAALRTLHGNLARHWFGALAKARIERPSLALLFERGRTAGSAWAPAEPARPSLCIAPALPGAVQTGPCALPLSSYLVVPRLDDAALAAGSYACHFIAPVQELRMQAWAETPVAVHFAWTAADGERHHADLLIGEEPTTQSIALDAPPLLEIEGACLMMQVRSLRPGGDVRLHLDALEGVPCPLPPLDKPAGPAVQPDPLATAAQDYLDRFGLFLRDESQAKGELSRQREELDVWAAAAERLFWECSQTHEEFSAARVRFAEQDDRCETMTRQHIQMTDDLKFLRENFLFTFFSLKFVCKQLLKIILAKLKLRPWPDPTPWLPRKPEE